MRYPILLTLALAALMSVASSAAPPANQPVPGMIRVRVVTADGAIVLALDARRAPKTTANFMAYVDDGRFDETTIYRASRRKSDAKSGYIQGGISTDARRTLPPIPHEPTSMTGIKHVDGTVSMARGRPGSATGNFIITAGLIPSLDARPDNAGYAAFGHVVAGMDVVRRILAKPTGGGSGAMKGEMILPPVRLITVQRLDGVAKPSTTLKPWLWNLRRRRDN